MTELEAITMDWLGWFSMQHFARACMCICMRAMGVGNVYSLTARLFLLIYENVTTTFGRPLICTMFFN